MADKKAAFYTLGCKVNTYDTEAMQELFENAGYTVVSFSEPADVYVVNTCTVTHLGDRKSRQMLRRARRANPKAVIIASGCYAQTAPETVAAIPEVDLVLGTADRGKIVTAAEEFMRTGEEKSYVHALADEAFENLSVSRTEGHTRAFVKIQDGCRQYCTYCIVPYARGPIRSRSQADALAEIARLAKAGYREIVLTGIHVASYGKDEGRGDALITLIEKAAQIPGVDRIRLSSLEPRLITDEFLTRLQNVPGFCPHFHLSLQSGSATVLKRMGRRYSPEEYAAIVQNIRRHFSKPAITTDIITGFPGETDDEFEETLAYIQKIGFARIHLFRFSPRTGTPAADMPNQVADDVKSARMKRIGEVEETLRHRFMQENIGRTEAVLIEEKNKHGLHTGHTANYIPVETAAGAPGDILSLKLTAYNGEQMTGEPV